MVTSLVAFFFAFTIALALTPVVRRFAEDRGLWDAVNPGRKVHVRPIPRLGGVAIIAGFFAPLCALFWVNSGVGFAFRGERALVWGLFGGGFAIAALGLWDDLRGLDARKKLAVQVAVALFLYTVGCRIDRIANPFGDPFSLGFWGLPLTVLWIVGVINAVNLIDGLDGLAGGVAFMGLATNFILCAVRGDTLMCLLMAASAGAVLGFLVFNFNPASIFMGDTGSMFLGFVLAAASIKTSSKSGTTAAMLAPVIALGLPIADTLLAIARRTLVARPIFSADQEHIHHRLMRRLLLSQRKAVLVLYGVCCLCGAAALVLSYANRAQSTLVLTAIAGGLIALLRKLGYLDLGGLPSIERARRRNLRLRGLIRDLSEGLREAQSFERVWEIIHPLVDVLGAAELELFLPKKSAGKHAVIFEREHPGAGPVTVVVDVKDGPLVLGQLRLAWNDGRARIDRDDERALELLAQQIGSAVTRCDRHGREVHLVAVGS